jgi:hypothetical protein
MSTPINYLDRTVTEVTLDFNESSPIALSEIAELPCFVLLAEPGMGKTSVFETMANQQSAQYITADNFLIINSSQLKSDTYWYIDALDEATDIAGKTVINAVRGRISEFSLQRFRLACRAADWNFIRDSEDIAFVAPNNSCKSFVLNPLGTDQIKSLLQAEGITKSDEFIHQFGLHYPYALLGNPQTLKIFLSAFKENDNLFPATKQEAYKSACSAMLRELNDRKNRDGQTSELLNAAGWLSAILLLSNKEGICAESSTGNLSSGFIPLNDVRFNAAETSLPTMDSVKTVLKRRVFESSNGCSKPIHRTIAEFLAAQYLTQRIADGLSPSRLSALLLIEGKTLVSNLRGLAGWLASMCEPMLEKILAADPQAVLNYGDLELLNSAARKRLIQELSSSHNFSYSVDVVAREASFGALVQDDMQAFLKEWLSDYSNAPSGESNSESQATVARVLLNALRLRRLHKAWGPLLESVVRNDSLKIDIRLRALDAMRTGLNDWQKIVIPLLNDINQQKLPDPSSKLLSRALEHLYPVYVTPSEVFKYAATSFKNCPGSSTDGFFTFDLNQLTKTTEILELVCALSNYYSDYDFYGHVDHQDWRTHLSVGDVIAKAILEFGTQVSVATLAQWHEWGIDGYARKPLLVDSPKCRLAISEWQTNHTDLVLKVIAYRLDSLEQYRKCTDVIIPESVRRAMGSFWLQQALEKSVNQNEKAIYCLRNACRQIEQYGVETDITLDTITSTISAISLLANELPKLLVCDLGSQDSKMFRKTAQSQLRQKNRQEKEAEKIETYFTFLRHNIEKIRNAELLDYLYNAAWADLSERKAGYVSSDMSSAISQRLKNEQALRDATDFGYVNSVDRLVELDVKTIRQSRIKKTIFYLELPSLLGAEILFAKNPEAFFQLADKQLGTLLLFSFGQNTVAGWVEILAQRRPNFFCEIWLEHAKWSLLKTDRDMPFLRSVVLSSTMKSVASLAMPRLLAAFPVKFPERNLYDFLFILAGAAANGDPKSISDILLKRLTKKSASLIQRTYLLMAGLFVDDVRFVPLIENALAVKEITTVPVLGFVSFFKFGQRGFSVFSAKNIPPLAAESLIKILAPLIDSEEPSGMHLTTPLDDARDFLKQLFRRLGDDFSDQTTGVFNRLLAQDLGHWQSWCTGVHQHRHTKKLNCEFNIPAFSAVVETLACRAPTNPSDLMAICTDLLSEYQANLKNSDLSDINSFWATDTNGKKPKNPHHPEPQCRNAIAQWLRPKLQPLRVSLSIEAAYGDQAQSDMQLLFIPDAKPEFMLPIEVKGDWHPELFTAAENQLYKKYSTNPRSNGNGIYLVLWTGPKTLQKVRYDTYFSLQTALTNDLKDKSNCSGIQVFVLDISI